MCLGEFTRGRLSVVAACAVQTEPEEALAVPLLSALYLCVRHNACASDKRGRVGYGTRRGGTVTGVKERLDQRKNKSEGGA